MRNRARPLGAVADLRRPPVLLPHTVATVPRASVRDRLRRAGWLVASVLAGGLVATGAAPVCGAGPPTPPAQPAAGPGGALVLHHAVTARRYGAGATAYWLFEPAE